MQSKQLNLYKKIGKEDFNGKERNNNMFKM